MNEITVNEASELSGFSQALIRYYCVENIRLSNTLFRCRKLGRRWIIDRDSFLLWAEKKKSEVF